MGAIGLLFIFRNVCLRSGSSARKWMGVATAVAIAGFEEETLAERGDGSGDDALGDVFDVDVGYVEDAEAALAHGGVEVFAAELEVEDAAAGGWSYAVLEGAACLGYVAVVARVGELLQVAAEDGGGLGALGDGDCREAAVAVGDVDVLAHEVEEVGALHE